jgi:beta,beta-carotene 9',10'-dioxygenase
LGIADSLITGGVKIAGVNFWVKGAKAARVPFQRIGEGLSPYPFVLVFPHHVNAFEEGDEVAVDIVAFPDSGVIDQLYLERLRSAEPVTATGKLTRFRIGSSGDARDERLSEAPIEFPRINYRCRAGRRYRYVYGAGNEVQGNFIDNLVKLDLERNATSSWYEEGCYPGEPVFVATPGASDEDDGVILSVVLDAKKASSFLLILDAASFRELARAEVSHHIPFGFHGNYFAETSGPESFPELHR